MATVTDLPPQKEQTAFNLRRWAEVLGDRGLSRFEGRVETDRYGRILMSPPPAPSHGSYQSEISFLLRCLLPDGRVVTECPISTRDGVRAADVAWASPEGIRALGTEVCFRQAPEICVEVVSPGNTPGEMRRKAELYFEAGAREVWLCGVTGRMKFLGSHGALQLRRSLVCPDFPSRVELR